MFGKKCCGGCNGPVMPEMFNNQNMMMGGEIIEPVINKCVEEECCHEVKHICPFHTHVIKRDVYNHVYTPQYTVSEEHQVVNNDNGSCCNFTR
jgi:hypothetical protein